MDRVCYGEWVYRLSEGERYCLVEQVGRSVGWWEEGLVVIKREFDQF